MLVHAKNTGVKTD